MELKSVVLLLMYTIPSLHDFDSTDTRLPAVYTTIVKRTNIFVQAFNGM